MKSLPDFVTVCQPNQSRPSSYASNPESWTKSLSRISLIRGSSNNLKAAIDSLAPDKGNLPKRKSFAGGLFEFSKYFNIGEKNASNDSIERARHRSASTPDVRESDKTPFSFKTETRPLMICGNDTTYAEKKLIPRIASSGKDTFPNIAINKQMV